MNPAAQVRKGWRAATHLMLYALLVAVPLLIVMGALLFRATELERQQLDQRMLQVLQALVDDLDRDIDRQITILNTLAAAPALAREDWRAFDTQARAALKDRAYVVLIDASGHQLVNTFVPYGEAPAMTRDMGRVELMRQTRKPSVSDIFISQVVKAPVYNVSIPILRDGELAYVLSIGLRPTDLLAMLRGQSLQGEWTTVIWDSQGRIMARSRDHETMVGAQAPPGLFDFPYDTVARRRDIAGREVFAARARSTLSSWTVGVSYPAAAIDRQVTDQQAYWVLTIAAAMIIVVGLALLFGQRITLPLAEATAAARALGRREPFVIRDSSLAEANEVAAALRQAQIDIADSSAALRESEERLRTAAEAAQFGGHEYDAVADRTHRSPQMRRLLGATDETTLEGGLAYVHPDDRDEVRRRKRAILDSATTYELEYRIQRPDGDVRWVMDRGLVVRDDQGKALRVLGVLLDISERKAAEQRQQLLFDELNHRVKNTLAIVQSLAQQTLRNHPDPGAFSRAFGDRVASLARAHDLLTQDSWRGATLTDVVTAALGPFADREHAIDISGDAVMVPANVTITLSLLLHELATNAAKYGALSVPAGRLAVTWQARESGTVVNIDMHWVEDGGPPVTPPAKQGFGSRFLQASALQLNAKFDCDYAPAGVRCRLRFAVPLMARDLT